MIRYIKILMRLMGVSLGVGVIAVLFFATSIDKAQAADANLFEIVCHSPSGDTVMAGNSLTKTISLYGSGYGAYTGAAITVTKSSFSPVTARPPSVTLVNSSIQDYANGGGSPASVTYAEFTSTTSTTVGVHTITFTVTNGYYTKTCDWAVTVTSYEAGVTGTISCAGSTSGCNVAWGSQQTISWSSTGTNYCTALVDRAWAGTSGTQTTDYLYQGTDLRGYLICYNLSGEYKGVIASVPVRILPRASIYCNGGGNCSINSGSSVTISWQSYNASSCSIPAGGWGGLGYASKSSGPLTTTTIYTITCTAPAGSVSASVTVTVNSPVATVSCSPTPLNLTAGDVPGNITAIVSVSNYNGSAITLTGTFESPAPSVQPSISYTNNPQSSPGTSTVTLSTTTSTSTGSFVFKITASGTGITSGYCNTTVNISAPPAPVIAVSCAPSPVLVVTKGGAPGVITVDVDTTYTMGTIEVEAVFNDPVPIVSPGISYTNSPQDGKSDISTVIITTSSSTSTGSFPLTITVSGIPSGKSAAPDPASCEVTIEVTGTAPEPPTNVQANANGSCGTIEVTWSRPSTGPIPSHYEVYTYVTIPGVGDYYQTVSGEIIDTGLGDGNFSFIDTNPYYPSSNNQYVVVSYVDGLYSDFALANPVIPTSCAPSLDLSDHDVMKVDNNTGGSTPCNSQSDIFVLPNQGVFKVGSTVLLGVNVCNSGNDILTGLRVELTDNYNLENFQLVPADRDPCGIQEESPGVFTLSDMEPKENPGDAPTVCVVTFTATITTTEKALGYLHRFWSEATITSNELAPKVVSTPPYLFSTSSTGTPVRSEAP